MRSLRERGAGPRQHRAFPPHQTQRHRPASSPETARTSRQRPQACSALQLPVRRKRPTAERNACSRYYAEQSGASVKPYKTWRSQPIPGLSGRTVPALSHISQIILNNSFSFAVKTQKLQGHARRAYVIDLQKQKAPSSSERASFADQALFIDRPCFSCLVLLGVWDERTHPRQISETQSVLVPDHGKAPNLPELQFRRGYQQITKSRLIPCASPKVSLWMRSRFPVHDAHRDYH